MKKLFITTVIVFMALTAFNLQAVVLKDLWEEPQPPPKYEPQFNPYVHPGRFEMAPKDSIPTLNPYAPPGEEWNMRPKGYESHPNPYNGKIE